MALAWQRTDDFDGTAAQQVRFGFEDATYVVDLSPANKKKLQQILQPYLTVGVEYAVMPPAPEPEGTQATSQTLTPRRTSTPRAREGVKPINGNGRGKVNGKVTTVPHATIRSWANENGYQVTPKGRIPDAIITAYEAAAKK